jgi:tetratricopeptide (TPR) repeat protein
MHSAARSRIDLALIALLTVLLLTAPSCHKAGLKVVAGREGYTHIVSRGETLESIAEKYYGDAALGRALGEYNGVDPLAELEPGRSLLVPFDRTELDKLKVSQDANVLYNRGTVLARTGQYEEASRYLESAVEADYSHVDAWYNLALVYNKLEKPERSLSILSRLVETYPSEKTYHYSLGATLRQAGRNGDALDEFEEALKIDDGYREAQYALALTFEDVGERRHAKRAWQRYLELDQDSVWSDEARMHLDRLEHR